MNWQKFVPQMVNGFAQDYVKKGQEEQAERVKERLAEKEKKARGEALP